MQHPVDDQNRGARARNPQTIVNGLRKLHRMAGRLQFEADLLGKIALVFHHKDRGAICSSTGRQWPIV
jgi:hypothetical protein